jgi:hypothetical protein
MNRAISRRVRYSCLAAVSGAAILAAGVSVPTVHDVSIALGDGQRLEIGTVRGGASLIGVALAQSADSVILENVTLDLGHLSYKAPKIEFSGVSLSRAELAGLFDLSVTEPLAARLARLSAKEIVAPELVTEQKGGANRSVTRYRNVVARDVVQGRMGSLTVDGAAIDVDVPEGKSTGTLGRITARDLDLAEAARLYSDKAGAAAPEMKRIYGVFSMENLLIAGPKGAEVRIARIAGKDFMARPTKDSWAETVKAMGAMDTSDKASAADKSRAMNVMLDFVGAFQIGSMEATGFDFRDPNGKEKANGRIARMAYTGPAAGQPAEARMEGMDFEGDDGRVRIANLSFSGFSFASTFEGMRSMAGKPMEKLDPTEARKLMPTIGTMRFSGLDVDVPDTEAKEKGQKLRFAVRDIEVTADKPLNGVPTNLRFGVDGVTFTVPPGAKQDGLRELSELGYTKLDVSGIVAASWNEAGNELVVREVSMRGSDMGGVTLRGTLGNITKDVFSPDTTVAMVSLIGATAKTLDVTVENKGLFEKVMAQQAQQQKKSPDDLRREYGMAAAVGIPALLGNTGSAKALGQAVARFITKPGRLAIAAKAKDGGGLGLADFASIGEPATILEKLDITATSE